jgi:hypothetical protein
MANKNKKKQTYTVVGIYEENNQPFATYVAAESAVLAAVGAFKHTDSPGDLVIVSVQLGKNPDLLNNAVALGREEIRELAKRTGDL